MNGHAVPTEKMRHDTLDSLAAAMAYFVKIVGEVPGVLKGDVNAAFRRIPIYAEHRWACAIVFMVNGKV